jgi:protocatechuate 3,4-dioxygenase, beta subunit
MKPAPGAWVIGAWLALGLSQSTAQERFPTMPSLQGQMPCGSCKPPSSISSQAAIAPSSEPGDLLLITGTVYEPDGTTPARDITLFLFHTDAKGHYNDPDDANNPRLYGWVRTGADGRYEFRTIRPGPYPSLTTPAHIHVHFFGPGRPEWFIPEYWFEGDPRIPAKDRDLPARLGLFSPVVRLTKGSDGVWRGQRHIRLEIQKDVDVIRTAYARPLRFAPGEKWEYCNLGYFMLGEIASKVSGKYWGDFLHERVFAPLGMTATRVTTTSDIIPNRADGYVIANDKMQNSLNWPAVRPSGAFLSTVLDLAK